VLEFRAVSVRYPAEATDALADCSFTVHPGERVALLGANGSGKTTVLAATVGLVAHNGSIVVDGEPLEPRTVAHVRRALGFLFSVPEDQLLFPRVLDDVAFTLRARGVPEHEAHEAAIRALRLLEAEELAERSPYRMSRGQRLRAALAGALVAEPPLLLLDEPTSGLDPAGRRLLARHLASLPAAMLVATHELEFARACCTRYLLLDHGRVVRRGTDLGLVEL
jgi:cobalt/nickel transport system ATP-binding protein